MSPFLLSEVFAINDELNIEFIQNPGIIVIDNLFKDWTKIRNLFLETPAPNWKIKEGSRNFIDYYDCRQNIEFLDCSIFENSLCKIISNVYDNKVNFNRTMYTNWFMQKIPRKSDYSAIHTDGDQYTLITYLNTEEECSGGTAFFSIPKTLKERESLFYWSQYDLKDVNPILHFKMKPGVSIIFDSKIHHAAWYPKDAFYDNPRLNIVGRFKSCDNYSI